MQTLTEKIIRSEIRDVFTDTNIVALLGDATKASRHGLVKRALAAKEVIRIRRGLYILATPYRKKAPNLYTLATKIYGPSYIGLESALWEHGWIPERVVSVVSGAFKRSKTFDTPLARFVYTKTPYKNLVGVQRVEVDPHTAYLLSSPLRALVDLAHKNGWKECSHRFLEESLRIEPFYLERLTSEDFEMLLFDQLSGPGRDFLSKLKDELGK